MEDGQGGRAAYRLSHQRLVDHLRRGVQPGAAAAGDEERAARLAQNLVDYYSQLLAGGLDAHKPTYLWLYLWRHCADGGQAGIDALRRLVADNPAFLPDLAGTLANLGNCYAEMGLRANAVAPSEEAVTLYQQLAADNPAFLPNFAGTLANLGNCYAGVGRRADAVAPSEEAVALYRELAADNPAFLPNLAATLNNLGGCYREVGRRADAVAPSEEAVALYRELAADNPAYLPDLAMALTNLGHRYAGSTGRRH